MARLIEVFVEDGIVKGHIVEEIYYEDTEELLRYMKQNLTLVKTTENYPFKDQILGIGHEECVIPLDASNECFGVGEKGILLILCDMPYHPYLLYENSLESDRIELV